ncbi:MAG: aspartate--tRNA ligase [Deltaproteobacteria bacterium]|nr:aspartate--tRNA ligase [Deltaproteobacteria bacterium]
MKTIKRNRYCGELGAGDAGTTVVLAGWVQKRRDHGGLIFIDLRDRSGIAQIVFSPDVSRDSHELAHDLRSEYVIVVRGEVRRRPEEMINPKLETGRIEVYVDHLEILNKSKTPPFMIEDDIDVSESLRLKYRYLDLRRKQMQKAVKLRHHISRITREFLNQKGFLEIETPILTKSTPEGARDYLVPSRVSPGHFYALPQSPQLFKQLLMMSGFERYYQIVRCFRDEDLRADRQPEFTQIDMELSFIDEEDIFTIVEEMIARIFRKTRGIEVKTPFLRMPYAEARDRFGLDKPDTRFGLELKDISGLAEESGFKVFTGAVASGGTVRGIRLPGCASYSRKDLDNLTEYVKIFGAKGLAWLKVAEGNRIESPIAKFFSPELLGSIRERLGGTPGDLLAFVADSPEVAFEALGNLRNEMGRRLGLIDKTLHDFLWITDFPLLEWDAQEKRYVALHHPFTAPREEDLTLMKSDPGKVRARAYDLVLNGSEIGGGSIRIHRQEVQEEMFDALGIDREEAKDRFGFLLEALEYGAPPHGGIAFGLDRITMILSGASSIREVIPFPKTQKAACLMTEAPSRVDKKQLDELMIRTEIVE